MQLNNIDITIYFSAATNHFLSLPVLLKFPMAHGKSINIPEQISDKYMTFGILLLNDDSGAIVDEISLRYLKNHVQINIDILRRWINGEGKLPVSWGTLTTCLRDTGLSKLADDIRQYINTFEGKCMCYSVSLIFTDPLVQNTNIFGKM